MNKFSASVSVVFVCVAVITRSVRAQDIVGFPIEGKDTINPNNNRQPVYIPGRCGNNELLYPGDQVDDWICDCMPGHLYHPKSDKCFPAFRQGPCGLRQYLILPKSKVIPVCTANPCRDDGTVLYKWRCEKLETQGSCPISRLGMSVIRVNPNTLALECSSPNLENRFGGEEESTSNATVLCLPGCKRSVNGKCVANAPVVL